MELIDRRNLEPIDLWGEDGDCHVVYEYDTIQNALTIEAIPKDQYEARLKADMVAMLEEVDLQFDEICFYKNMGEWKTVPEIKAEYKAIIQKKINALEEE